jgi:EsV-1-7 cysteine-rich motif
MMAAAQDAGAAPSSPGPTAASLAPAPTPARGKQTRARRALAPARDTNNKNNAGRECGHAGCFKRATFGPPGAARPVFCREHRQPGMLTHDARRCGHIAGSNGDGDGGGCDKRPNFGFAHDPLPTRCRDHRLPGMVALDTRACSQPGCGHRARYARDPSARPAWCLLHRTPDMVNVTRQGCERDGCIKYPCYGYEHGDRRPTCCALHRRDGMVNVKQKRCKTPMCAAYAYSPLNRGLCARCFVYTYPDAVRAKKYRTKEAAVAAFLGDAFPALDFQRDRVIAGGCSRYRPDLLCDLLTHVLMVEIDEHQHEGYDQVCENRRVASLWQDLAHRPVVFVRFNPDAYVCGATGRRQGSCFRYDRARGVPYVARGSNWDARLDALRRAVAAHAAEVPARAITVVQLFYDGHCEAGAGAPPALAPAAA